MENYKNTIQESASPLSTPPKENFIKELVKFTLVAVAIVIPVRMYVAQPFIVSGASMDPTFASGQYLIVDQLTYHFNDPKRDDVIIFRYPRDPDTFFIKRVVGLPGETVVIENGTVKVVNPEHPEGMQIEDPTNKDTPRTFSSNPSTTLGPTEYFVLGDNRQESSDSRVWGPLEEKYIVGRPLIRLYPVSKVAVLPGR